MTQDITTVDASEAEQPVSAGNSAHAGDRGRARAILSMRWWPAILSLGSLAAAVWWGLGQQTPQLPSSAGAWGLLVGALALYALVTALRAERWHRIVVADRIRVSRRDTYGLTTVGYMGNNVLPARGGELLKVWLLARQAVVSKRRVLGTVLAERILDSLALAILFALVGVQQLTSVSLKGGVVLLVGATLALLAAASLAPRLLAALSPESRLARWAEIARPVGSSVAALRSARGVALLVLSLLLWGIEAGVYSLTAAAADVQLDLAGAVYVVILTNFAGLIPSGPGYVGTFDSAVIVALRTTGQQGAAAVSYLLLLRFVLFVPVTVVGLIVLVARYGGWARYREALVSRARSRDLAPQSV